MTHELRLEGLEPSRMLGFLAAIGTLHALDRALGPAARVRLRFVDDGQWTPELTAVVPLDRSAVVAELHRVLGATPLRPGRALDDDDVVRAHPWLGLRPPAGDDAKPPDYCADSNFVPATWREHVEVCRGSGGRGSDLRFLAGLATDVHAGDDAAAADTDLRTMSGAGHQHFLGFIRELIQVTLPEHLHSALFEPWVWADDKPSMRWDPQDVRLYALRADNPSRSKENPIRTVRGGNRLAIEALALLPVVPESRAARTAGFTVARDSARWFNWPVWTAAIGVDTVRSLLLHPLVLRRSERQSDRDALQRLGVPVVFRAQRLRLGKFRGFGPATYG